MTFPYHWRYVTGNSSSWYSDFAKSLSLFQYICHQLRGWRCRLLSKSALAMTNGILNNASKVFYSGPLATTFINFTLENIIVYLIWEDTTGFWGKTTVLPENDSRGIEVSCHYLTKFHNRESTGDCGPKNDLPSKIQFSDSHCAPFLFHNFSFFCHLSKTISLADSLVSAHQDCIL